MMTNQRPYKSKPYGSILTTWNLTTYDVLGNAKEGYEVNDAYRGGEIHLRIPQTQFNVGTPHAYIGAHPTHRQIKLAFGVTCQINIDGDDLHVMVTRRRDGYPIGELSCISHVSLCPVRKV